MKRQATLRSPLVRLTITIALAITTVLSGVVTPPAQAQPASETTFYFPWVPNGDDVNGQGPWYGKLSFQNLSDGSCSIIIYIGRTGSWTRTAQLSIPGGASRSISSSSLAVPRPGAPIRIEAFCPMTASVKLVTPDVNDAPWSDGAHVITGYTGLSNADLATVSQSGAARWYLPIVQTNSGWNSFIRLANLEPNGPIDYVVRLYSSNNPLGADGVVAEIPGSLAIGTTTQIDVLHEIQIPDWVGFAEIQTTGAAGAYVLRAKPSTSMALINVASAADPTVSGEQFRVAAPLLFTAFNGWNTGINIANVADAEATATIRYFVTAGEMVREEQVVIPARSMTYLYTPAQVEQEEFVGSAVIESDYPIVAAIDEVKYESGDGISYVGSTVGQTLAAIPVTFRSDPANGRHDNSGINIHNLNPDAEQTVEIQFIRSSGEVILDEPIRLTMPPGGNNFIYLPQIDGIPQGTVAAAKITSPDEIGFVALSNDVNYSVAGDGSVTFMAAGEAGYYRVLAAQFAVPEPSE